MKSFRLLILALALGLLVLAAMIGCDVLGKVPDDDDGRTPGDDDIVGDDDADDDADDICGECNDHCDATKDCPFINYDPSACPVDDGELFVKYMCNAIFAWYLDSSGSYLRACGKGPNCNCLTVDEYIEITGCDAW